MHQLKIKKIHYLLTRVLKQWYFKELDSLPIGTFLRQSHCNQHYFVSWPPFSIRLRSIKFVCTFRLPLFSFFLFSFDFKLTDTVNDKFSTEFYISAAVVFYIAFKMINQRHIQKSMSISVHIEFFVDNTTTSLHSTSGMYMKW